MNQENASLRRQDSIFAYTSLITNISKQEYNRIEDRKITFATVARLAALAVRIATLSGYDVNLNMMACIIRRTIRQELEIYYSS